MTRERTMAHCIVPEAEQILDKEFPVLNKGFVRLVDYLGGDQRIVQSARVSYGEGTKTFRADKGLINYLLRNEHTSPFEQVIMTFHIKMPLFIARQWVRHRTARMNEISGRYSVLKDDFYVPEMENINFQSEDNKQGRSDKEVPAEMKQQFREEIEGEQRTVYAAYNKNLENGIARELARINLPLSLYTEFYWQMDLHNLFHFLKLRLDPHAQWEIRQYGKVLLEICRTVCPMATEVFEDNTLNGAHFSGEEMNALRKLVNGKNHDLNGRQAELFENKLWKSSEL